MTRWMCQIKTKFIIFSGITFYGLCLSTGTGNTPHSLNHSHSDDAICKFALILAILTVILHSAAFAAEDRGFNTHTALPAAAAAAAPIQFPLFLLFLFNCTSKVLPQYNA